MAASRKNRNRNSRKRTMRGGAGKRLLCDCQEVGATGRRFSASNVGMAALTIPAFESKGKKGKGPAKTKRAVTEKMAQWQAEIARAFSNMGGKEAGFTRMNATKEAKARRAAGTVPANLAVAAVAAANVAANTVLNSGAGNAQTRKAQRNVERAEKAAAAAAEKAAKQQAAANAKAAKAQAAANARVAKEAEKLAKGAEAQAKKDEKAAAARAKAEATAQAAAARLAALQAKLMGK